MKYSRIDLSKTNYTELSSYNYVPRDPSLFPVLVDIYQKYCEHKNFESVMPLFERQLFDQSAEIVGYLNNDNLVAFSLLRIYDSENIEAVQFAWDYADPKLRLGIESLKNECALYKARGFKYLYLGPADEYKAELQGFEIIGKLTSS